MKLFLVCILILVFLLSACFLSTITVTEITNQTKTHLQNAAELYQAEKYAEGYEQILLSETIWKKNGRTLGLLLYHSEIDKVETELAKLKAYAAAEDTDELYSTCAELFALLKRIREMEYPYLKNIL